MTGPTSPNASTQASELPEQGFIQSPSATTDPDNENSGNTAYVIVGVVFAVLLFASWWVQSTIAHIVELAYDHVTYAEGPLGWDEDYLNEPDDDPDWYQDGYDTIYDNLYGSEGHGSSRSGHVAAAFVLGQELVRQTL